MHSNPTTEGETSNGGESEKGFWQLERTQTEEEIFEKLGMDYVEPHRRNFGFLNKRMIDAQHKNETLS